MGTHYFVQFSANYKHVKHTQRIQVKSSFTEMFLPHCYIGNLNRLSIVSELFLKMPPSLLHVLYFFQKLPSVQCQCEPGAALTSVLASVLPPHSLLASASLWASPHRPSSILTLNTLLLSVCVLSSSSLTSLKSVRPPSKAGLEPALLLLLLLL